MAWYDFLATGADWAKGAHSDIHKGIFGDPEAVKAAYEKAMGDAKQGGQDITNFLMGQQAKAQKFYQPLSQLFQNTYGTGTQAGLQSPQVPQAIQPLDSIYGR